jgi:hypothetical protein
MNKNSELTNELEQLFDIRHAKTRTEKNLNNEAMAAQRDIRLLTHMFREGIPDITVSIGNYEEVRWDSERKRLLLIDGDEIHLLEASSRETMIRVRPYLSLLVKAAKEFYSND